MSVYKILTVETPNHRRRYTERSKPPRLLYMTSPIGLQGYLTAIEGPLKIPPCVQLTV